MNIVVVSFNGTNINDGTTYNAYIERSQAAGQAPVDAMYVSRAGAWPIISGKTFKPMTYVLKVDCSPGATVAGYLAKFEDLNQLFSNEDETPRELVVYDDDDSDRQYSIWCTPTGQPTYDNEGPIYTVKLALDDPVWQSTTDNSLTWTITGSTDSTDVTAGGNADSYPVFQITPTTQPSTDFLYSTFMQVLPRSTKPWINRPLNITSSTDGNTFDTAALIAAGKMQADGDDLRVVQDGVEVDRWVNGLNTTDTQVWVVADMPPQRNMSLKTALGAGAETIIELNYTNINKTAFSAIPSAGRLILDASLGSTDTEEFTYTAKKLTPTRMFFTIGERAVRNTTAIAHGINSNVRFLPYDFTIVYGNTSVEAPDVDDTTKPIISLASSNESLIYTNFYDTTQSRAGIWKPSILRVSNATLTNSKVYTSTDDLGDTDPSSVMGCSAESYLYGGLWKPDTVTIEWRNYFPDCVASIASISGEQSQSVAGIPAFRLQSSTDGIAWLTQFSLSPQVSTDYGTWTTWTKATTDATFPTVTRYLRFVQIGTISGSTDYYSKVGVSGITVGLTSFPHVMFRAENVNVKLDATIGNSTTGESFRVIAQVETNKTVTIDTDPNFPTVKYRGRIINGAIKLNDTRAAWLKLQPGSNTLTYDSNLANANDVTITVTWKDRKNFL